LIAGGCSVDVDLVLFNTTGKVIIIEVADKQPAAGFSRARSRGLHEP
jgi:hypothetical protein